MSLSSSANVRARSTWILALLVAFTAGALYLRTLQPTLGGMFNSEEFQQAAYALALAHSTGYPLYLLLGKIFITLIPFGDAAYRMNLFSAVCASGAAVLVFLLIVELARNRAAAVLGALMFVTNEAVWRYASVAEVDTLTAFLAGALFLSLLLWRKERAPLWTSALLYGLALAHHRTSIFYAPGIFLFLYFTRRAVLRERAFLLSLALVIFVPLLFYLYVPLRAHTAPDYVGTPQAFINYVVGLPTVQSSQSSYPIERWLPQADLILRQYLWNWFAGIGILLAAIGFFGFPRTSLPQVNRATRFLLLLPFLFLTLFSIPPRAPDIDRYLLVPVMVLAIGFGLGIARLAQWLEAVAKNPLRANIAQAVLVLLLFALPLYAAWQNFPKVDYSQNDEPHRLWTEIFDLPLETGAVIIGNWSESNSMLYMQRVEGRRPDLRVGSVFTTEDDVLTQLEKFARADAVYLAPGSPSAGTEFFYTALGPLLRITPKPISTAPSSPVAAQVNFGNIELIGYGWNVSLARGMSQQNIEIEPNESARLTLAWQVEKKPDAEYNVRLRLVDADGRALWQRVEQPLRGFFPTTRWRKGSYVSDSQLVYIPPGTPPGDYRVEVALVDRATEGILNETARLDGIQVVRSRIPLAEQVFVQQRLNIRYPNLEMLGYSGGRNAEKPGNTLHVASSWRALEKLERDYMVRFTLVNPDGSALAPTTVSLLRDFPTSQWVRDDAFKAYYAVPIPRDAQAGRWTLRLALLDEQGNVIPSVNPRGDANTLFSFEVQP